MDDRTTISILAFVVSLFALLVSAASLWVAYRRARTAEEALKEQAAASARVAILEFLVREYAEREFKAGRAPKIDGVVAPNLRYAKEQGKKLYESHPEEWDEASKLVNRDNWQNAVAHETAWVLEHLGAAVFSGALPLRLTLAISAGGIVNDWLLCRSWVRSYREEANAVSKLRATGTRTVNFNRRHAEWLALVATLWMRTSWHYPQADVVADRYGGIDNLADHLRDLSRADKGLMPARVRDDVKALTGIDLE
jgi:hypothetical protein